MGKVGKKEKLKNAVKEAHKEILARYEPIITEDDNEEENIEDEEENLVIKVLEIRSNILKYVEEENLPLCEYMSIENFGDFMNKIFN